MRILTLQHIACEPPGVYEEVLLRRGIELHRVELDEGEAIPDWRDFNGLISMGGPMSVNDDTASPWLKEEKAAIGEAVRGGLPYWGVCLGSQLLAAGLGACVYKGPAPEVGVLPVYLTEVAHSDRVFIGLPHELPTLQWHNDTFELPPEAVLLASSSLYPVQAFRWGAHAYGLQFHVEVSPHMAREWAKVPAYASDVERVLGPGSLPRLIDQLDRSVHVMNQYAREMFERWLSSVVEVARA
jgi:GMP synthase-like glutamine amidotransferase